MKGATAPEATAVPTAGSTRKSRSCRVRKEKSSRNDGLGASLAASTAVVARECVDSCAERGSLYVESTGEEDVLAGAFSSVSMVRSAGRPMVVVGEDAREGESSRRAGDASLLSKQSRRLSGQHVPAFFCLAHNSNTLACTQ